MEQIEGTYIAAYLYHGAYRHEQIIFDINEYFSNMEYFDVINDEYQLWKYPSGEIYRLQPDQEVFEKDKYSLPSAGWTVIKIKIGQDKEKVQAAYDQIMLGKKSNGHE